MATPLTLALDRRGVKKDGTFPICLRLNFDGTQSYIGLKRSIDEKYWSQPTGRVTKGAPCKPSPGHWNDYLQEKLTQGEAVIAALKENGTLLAMSHADLKAMIVKGAPRPVTFSAYLDHIIEEFVSLNNHGQAKIYRQAKSFMAKYGDNPDNNYTFEQVNYRLLRLMESRYTPRIDGTLNGMGVSFRTLRAVWNRAIKEEVVKADRYPFKTFKIKKSKTHKSAISRDAMMAIAGMSLPAGSFSWHGRNYFLFSFHCRGMNFADIAQLRWGDAADGRISYVRTKTRRAGKHITIGITPAIRGILDQYYTPTSKPQDYIFPIIDPKSEVNLRLQAQYRLTSINHALKRWAKQLSLPVSLSFNTARHSWATIGRNMSLPIAVISQGLGHGDIETTAIYLDEFDNATMDEATALISEGMIAIPGGAGMEEGKDNL